MLDLLSTWADDLAALHARFAHRFRRAEPRRHALGYIQGLLSTTARKNSWQLAETLGQRNPYSIQRLLGRDDWSADALRDDLRAYATEHLAHDEAVLVLDETGFLKKGTHSAGVARQYCGTAGRVENCQIGVFLLLASPQGSAFVDRKLYLPKAWTDDRDRCRAAGIPDEVAFATKPDLARQMLERAFTAGAHAAFVTGDCVYGSDRRLRSFLEQRRQAFVLAVKSNEPLWHEGPIYHEASALAGALPDLAWQRLSAGAGSKGERIYDWALVELWRLQMTDEERAWGHYLLVRRSVSYPEHLAYYVVFCRREQARLARLVAVAGQRWRIEQGFEEAKGVCGLDEYEVRSFEGWHRHVTLSLMAHAFVSVMRSRGIKGAHLVKALPRSLPAPSLRAPSLPVGPLATQA